MILEKYDIILCKNSKKLSSKLVRLFTKNIYNHAQIYMGDLHIIDDHTDGVKVRNFNNALGDFDAYRYHRPLTKKEKLLVDEFLQKSINSKYDIIELLLQAFNKQARKNKKYICITLLMEAFEYAGVDVGEWQMGFSQVCDSKLFVKVNK